jgi:hypothetical protein
MGAVAIVLWGDRGLKHIGAGNANTLILCCDRPLGRSRIETSLILHNLLGVYAPLLRSSFGAIED